MWTSCRLCVDFMWTPCGLHEDYGDSMRTPCRLHEDYEDSMRTPWKPVGDCKIQGVLQANILILSIHIWCSGFQRNRCPFFCIANSGPVYADMSGIKCARYCTNPRNLCMSCLFLGVLHPWTQAILSKSV